MVSRLPVTKKGGHEGLPYKNRRVQSRRDFRVSAPGFNPVFSPGANIAGTERPYLAETESDIPSMIPQASRNHSQVKCSNEPLPGSETKIPVSS